MTAVNGNEAPGVAQVRFARATDRIDELIEFYNGLLGLPVIALFSDHDGYDGVMLGLPDARCHLEFTHHRSGSPAPAPDGETLLVLYIPERSEFQRLVNRLEEARHRSVSPENPYWDQNGAKTFEDPDGWRVVLMPTDGI